MGVERSPALPPPASLAKIASPADAVARFAALPRPRVSNVIGRSLSGLFQKA